MATPGNVGRKRKTGTVTTPVKGNLPDLNTDSDINDKSNLADRGVKWLPQTDHPSRRLMPMNRFSTAEPVLVLRVNDSNAEHKFFVHQFLLSSSEYFKDLFAHQPGLAEHTLPPGPDVETVGNYVSFLYTLTPYASMPNSDINSSLPQLITLARLYRFTCNDWLDHIWVMGRAYNMALDILRNMEISWRNEDTALQTVRMAQSAFAEWSAGYERRESALKIAYLIAVKFAQTCPENVFDTYAEELERKFTNAILLQLMRDKQKEMASAQSSPSSSVTAGQRPGSMPVMQGAPPSFPRSMQHLISPTIAQGISPVTPPGFRQATNVRISPPARKIARQFSLPELQTRTQTPSSRSSQTPISAQTSIYAQAPMPPVLPQWPQPAVLGTSQRSEPSILREIPERFASNVPARYRRQRGHSRSVSENAMMENRRKRK
ncbi:hypothetical protein PG984_012393 [Apiospora sp. TS-2023a]